MKGGALMKKCSGFILAVLFALICIGCQNTNNRALEGAGIGGILGAAAGGIIGHQSGHGGEGALVGAAVGAAGGAIVGSQIEKNPKVTKNSTIESNSTQ